MDRSVWQFAYAITGDQGARMLLRTHHERVTTVPAGDTAVALDVDTEEQYREVLRMVGGREWAGAVGNGGR
jgi:CTP:molybdopterin cytidylyltransferase MocA